MKHAVILAHPKPDSLCAGIAAAYAAAARHAGHSVTVRDLYAADFDPRLKASEIPTSQGYVMAADVMAERAKLADTDVFVFVYPLWFNAPPAMLKGYVDRVFSMGFGYEPDFGGDSPLLTGRGLLTFSTSGAPDEWVRESDVLHKLAAVFHQHLAAVTGVSVAGQVHFGGIAGELSSEEAKDIFDEVKATVTKLFPGKSAPF